MHPKVAQIVLKRDKDGWTITHDPFVLRVSEAIKVQIDLAAEGVIAADRDSEKIAVEIN